MKNKNEPFVLISLLFFHDIQKKITTNKYKKIFLKICIEVLPKYDIGQRKTFAGDIRKTEQNSDCDPRLAHDQRCAASSAC